MKKRKLNYRFHNPNPEELFADMLLKVLVEANQSRVERLIQQELCVSENQSSDLQQTEEQSK